MNELKEKFEVMREVHLGVRHIPWHKIDREEIEEWNKEGEVFIDWLSQRLLQCRNDKAKLFEMLERIL